MNVLRSHSFSVDNRLNFFTKDWHDLQQGNEHNRTERFEAGSREAEEGGRMEIDKRKESNKETECSGRVRSGIQFHAQLPATREFFRSFNKFALNDDLLRLFGI